MNESKPALISIIVPCYNTPKQYVQRALSSILAQTLQDFEIIVVDDGSDTKYLAALEELCKDAEGVHLIKASHGGVSAARNIGIEHARGEFIAFLDADDIVSPDFLERALAVQRKTKAELVIGGTYYTADLDDYRFPERPPFPDYRLYREEEVQKLRHVSIGPEDLIRFPGGYVNRGPVARLVKAALVKSTPFDSDLKNGEDIIWNLGIFGKCSVACVVYEVWYGYWINSGSITHRYIPSFFEDSKPHLDLLAQLLNLSNKQEYAAYIDRIFEQLLIGWTSFLSKVRVQDREAYRNTVYKLYTEKPWTEIGSNRCFTAVGVKRKVISVLYRLHLYFFVKAMKERFLRL